MHNGKSHKKPVRNNSKAVKVNRPNGQKKQKKY